MIASLSKAQSVCCVYVKTADNIFFTIPVMWFGRQTFPITLHIALDWCATFIYWLILVGYIHCEPRKLLCLICQQVGSRSLCSDKTIRRDTREAGKFLQPTAIKNQTGPVDNRPSTDQLHHFVQYEKSTHSAKSL